MKNFWGLYSRNPCSTTFRVIGLRRKIKNCVWSARRLILAFCILLLEVHREKASRKLTNINGSHDRQSDTTREYIYKKVITLIVYYRKRIFGKIVIRGRSRRIAPFAPLVLIANRSDNNRWRRDGLRAHVCTRV